MKHTLIRALLLGLVLATPLATPAVQKKKTAKPARVQLTGIFSSLKYGAESGDVGGMEIFIMLVGTSEYRATVQIAEGVPGEPSLVPVTVTGNTIEFSFPEGSDLAKGLGTFRGTITAAGLNGKFQLSEEKVFLKRKASYWQ